jgi:RimJ/RimL family protein N-acetyltransferase
MDALIGDRVVVRDLRRGDLDTFVAYRRDPAVARYQSWTTHYDRASADALLAAQSAHRPGRHPLVPPAGAWRQLAIADGARDRLMGDVAVHALADQPDTYEIGITVAPAHQGRGVAREALRLVVDGLFAGAGAHRVVAQADDRNGAVHRTLESLGLRLEGRFVDADWFKGEWATLRCYAVLAEEWAT